MNIITVSSTEIWQKAANMLLDKIIEADSVHGKSLILLSGGSTKIIYSILAGKLKKYPLHANRLAFAQVDERFQPGNRDDINAYQIKKTGLPAVLKEKNISFYPISQKGSLENASREYDKTINKLFSGFEYKMAVLGLGKDGHTAGLLPANQVFWDSHNLVAGYENRGHFQKRISLTPKAIKMLDYALVAVSGEAKEANLIKILKAEETDVDKIPGIILMQIQKADLITDLEVDIP